MNRQQKTPPILPLLFLLGAIVAIYGHTLGAFFHLDDFPTFVLKDSLHWTELNGEKVFAVLRGNRPIPGLSFGLNYYFGGLNVSGYHLVNISIHVLNAFLVYLIFYKTLFLVQSPEKTRTRTALFAALLWAVHPVQTQAVTYIVQRMTTLVAFFFFLSLYFYILAREKNGKASRFYFFFSILSAFLAFGTKENSLMLSPVIMMYEVFFISRFRFEFTLKRLFAILFLLFSFLSGLLYIGHIYIGSISNLFPALSRNYGGGNLDPVLRMMTEWRVLVFYLTLLLFPLPGRMNLDHDFISSVSLFNPYTTLFSLLLIVSMAGYALWNAKKKPLVSFSILWFLINLVIESSFVRLDLVFEHRLYLPSVMLFLPVSVIIFSQEWNFPWRQRKGIPVLAGLLIILLMFLTYERNKVWETEPSLWNDVVSKSPRKAKGFLFLGAYYLESGNVEMAIKQFKTVLELDQENVKAHYDLGIAFQAHGNNQRAIEEYSAAIRLLPDFPDAHFNLGNAYLSSNQNDLAVREYRTFIQLNYSDNLYNSQAHIKLGVIFLKKGDILNAQKEFEEGVRLSPHYSFSQYNYAVFLEIQGKKEEAVKHYEEARKWIIPRDSIRSDMIEERLKGLK